MRLIVVTAVVLLGLGSAACSSKTYRALPLEKSIPDLAERMRTTAASPQTTVRVPVVAGNGRRFHIALHESGPADADHVVVMIHGVLSDARVWRYVRGELAANHRLILVDLPGSGASDAPSPRSLGPDGYAPEALCNAVLDALSHRLKTHGAPRRITMVGHSLGGMLIVRMLSDETIAARHAAVLDRVEGAVLFTPIDVALEKELPVFREIVEVTDLEIGLARLTGLLREVTAQSTRQGMTDPAMATREEADRLFSLLANARQRHAHQAMLSQAVPWINGRPNWEEIETITVRYGAIRPRCLIVWGARDELFPLSMGYKLALEVPRARLQVVPAAMHSLPTEHPALCAGLIRDFIESSDAAPSRATLRVSRIAIPAPVRVAAGWVGSYLLRHVDGVADQDAAVERISRTPPSRRRPADAEGPLLLDHLRPAELHRQQ